MRTAQRHANDVAHVELHLDDEHLFVIAHKERAPAVGGEQSTDLDLDNVLLHWRNLVVTGGLIKRVAKGSPACLPDCFPPRVLPDVRVTPI